MSLPQPSPAAEARPFDVFTSLLHERSIFLNGPIDDAVSATLCAQLLFLESRAPGSEIVFYINSPGGVITSGLAVYDTMHFISAPVATVCLGTARSMGSLLLMAGAPGRRMALPNASMLLHQPSGGFQGAAADLARHAADILSVKQRITQLYVKHCARTYAEVERTLDRDHFMSAEEAQAWGLIDRVIAHRHEVLPASP